MPNKIKKQIVSDIEAKLKTAKSTGLLQYQGLSADELSQLRRLVKEKGGVIEVFKNTLITRALEKLGIKLPQKLVGPTALAFGNDDEIAPLKEIDAVNKNKQKTEFKYAIYNQKLLTNDQLKSFVSLPSQKQLITNFVAGLKNPLNRLAYSLNYNQTRLVLALKAIATK